MKKRKPPKESKEYTAYRVIWMCPKCGGEGGDMSDELFTLKEAKKWAKDMEKEGMVCDIEGFDDGWEETK